MPYSLCACGTGNEANPLFVKTCNILFTHAYANINDEMNIIIASIASTKFISLHGIQIKHMYKFMYIICVSDPDNHLDFFAILNGFCIGGCECVCVNANGNKVGTTTVL